MHLADTLFQEPFYRRRKCSEYGIRNDFPRVAFLFLAMLFFWSNFKRFLAYFMPSSGVSTSFWSHFFCLSTFHNVNLSIIHEDLFPKNKEDWGRTIKHASSWGCNYNVLTSRVIWGSLTGNHAWGEEICTRRPEIIPSDVRHFLILLTLPETQKFHRNWETIVWLMADDSI